MDRRLVIAFAAMVLLLALDQGTKAWVRAEVPLHRATVLVPHLLELTHVENRGVSFSLLGDLGDAVRVVLGNHDLQLIALAHGFAEPRRKDTVTDLLEAEDGQELVAWLRRQPLLYSAGDPGWTMVHAALHPQWDLEEAHSRAEAVAGVLQGPRGPEFAGSLSAGGLPTREPEPAREWEWLRFNAAVLTRTRFCTADGEFAWGGEALMQEAVALWVAEGRVSEEGRPVREPTDPHAP